MKQAYMYRRVSTQQQTEKFGLDLQLAEIEKYARENDIEIVGSYEDDGISGTTIDRPGLQDMIADLEANNVKYIIVYNCTRLWRSEEIAGLLRYQLFKMKVDIISVQEPSFSLFTSDPSTFLVNQIMQALATYDRMQINQKLARARRVKVETKHCKACGLAPIGYRWTAERTIEPDPAAAPMIADIFSAYLRLGSLGRLVKYCEEKGYRTQRGSLFSKSSLDHILKNSFYIGSVTHAGEQYEGTHEPIIDPEVFDEVNKVLSGSRNCEPACLAA